MAFIQEATNLMNGKTLEPVSSPYQLPDQKDGAVVFLLSGSYEYDIELIKRIPPPRINFKYIMIPRSVHGKVGTIDFKYQLGNEAYKRKVDYIQQQKIVPQLQVLMADKIGTNNVYIPLSDVMHKLNESYRRLSTDYLLKNAPSMLTVFLNLFVRSKKSVILVNTDRYRIYDGDNPDACKSDLINGVIQSFMNEPVHLKNDVTVIFRGSTTDYKMHFPMMTDEKKPLLQKMCDSIGTTFKGGSSVASVTDDDDEDVDTMLNNINADKNASSEDQPTAASSGGSGLKNSLQNLRKKLGDDNGIEQKRDSLYSAKTLQINASLIRRINPNQNAVSDYKRIAADLTSGGDTPVEDRIIDQASKEIADSRAASNETDVMNTISTPRESSLRANIGQIRLKSLNINAMASVTDVPKPPPVRPIKITTTNRGAMQGSSFANMQETYEEQMLDQDIVASFMALKKLPEGFDVEHIDVEDISTPVSMLHNWKVALRNKRTGTKSNISIYVPKLMNGRFYYNGVWNNIGRQEFPIPVLKLNKKRVMLTTNYNKIDIVRYDTKSLVDITMLLKSVASQNKPDGTNPYVRYGSSASTNSRFISTIEYDEYARRWVHYENNERKIKILFNREQCLRDYGFVNVEQNEFCCGMIDQVPIVLNTETGLDRHGKTLTEIIVSTLTDDMLKIYNKSKPGKISMYADMKIGGIMIPIGVGIAAWEGLSSLLTRSKADYKYIGKNDDAPGYIKIPFKDKTLAIKNTVQNQLLFNGFFRLNPKEYATTDLDTSVFDDNSIFIDIFNQLFFKQFSQLTIFKTNYHFFIDPITEDVCQHYHLPNNICDMLIYATNLLSDNHFASENNASLYRIRASEVVPAIIHNCLARAISKYNNQVGSKTRDAKLPWNPNEVIQELLKVPTVSGISALNPMVEMHSMETISKKGFHGVNEDKAYSLPKRSYDPTMIGKIAISSPNNGEVGINRQTTIDPKIESVRGYTSTEDVNTDFNDLQLASFSELFTPGTVTRDDAIRTAIATSQTSHILPTADAEPVLVSNGLDEIIPSYLSDEFAVMAKENGKVLEISNGYMIVQYASGKKQAIPVSDRYSFNPGSGFYVDNKLKSNFEKDDTFEKNDILAYHEKFFSKDSSGMVRMNIGPLAKVAFAGLYSTYEDAGLITHKMSDRLSSAVTMCQASKLNATDDIDFIVKVGDEIEIGDPLIVFGLGDTGDKAVDNFLKAFQSSENILDTAKRTIKSKHAGRVAEIRMYTVKSMDKLSPSLFDILDKHFKENIEKRKTLDKHDKSDGVYKLGTLYSLPTAPLKGPTIKGINCDVLIEIYIEHSDSVSVGDKCVVYAASKQVISEVVPEGLEPYAESTPDEEISMFVSPRSILGRMIPSMLVTASANKILIELKKKVRQLWQG